MDQKIAGTSRNRDLAKVFEINDCDWWVGWDAGETLAAYLLETGIEPGDCEDPPRVLTHTEMYCKRFFPDPERPGEGMKSFAQELERLIRSDEPIPGWFASSES